MRIVILTDSLGCPREDFKVEEVWTEKLLATHYSLEITFYTCCIFGLSVKSIPIDYIRYLKPDVIICQIGIVDACRRALSVKEETRIKGIPLINRVVRKLCSTKHYSMTKVRNIHRADANEFSDALDNLSKIAIQKLALIEIAPPGEYLVKKIYHVKEDVELYNKIIDSKEGGKVEVLKPYSIYGIEKKNEYIRATDGHHLNNQGHDIVYKAVDKFVSELITQKAHNLEHIDL